MDIFPSLMSNLPGIPGVNSPAEMEDYCQREIKKAKFEIIELTKEGLPDDYVTAAKAIQEKIFQSKYYDTNKYYSALIEEYIPMMGMVWRVFVCDKRKICDKLKKTAGRIEDRTMISGSHFISVYYDNKDVLAPMSRPYFEIYDGNDIERFFPEEVEELCDAMLKILKSKQ